MIKYLGSKIKASLGDRNPKNGHISYIAILITQARNEEGINCNRIDGNERQEIE